MKKLVALTIICLLSLAVSRAPAHAVTVLTSCQAIQTPGTYELQATQSPSDTGVCFDIFAPNVHITAASKNSFVTCSSMGFGVAFEGSAYKGVFDGGAKGDGIQFNGCRIPLEIAHQSTLPGVTVNLTGDAPMVVNGVPGCLYSIWAADSERVHLNFGSMTSKGGGLQGTCPGGEISPHVGGNLPTNVTGSVGPQ